MDDLREPSASGGFLSSPRDIVPGLTTDPPGGSESVGPRMARRTAARRRREARNAGANKRGSFWPEFPVLIVLALLLAILIKTFLVQAFYIPSGSMENTLQVRDRVLVNKVVYHFRDIRRGEVVVFNGLDSFSPEVTVAEPTNPVGKGLRWLAGLLGFAPPGERDFIKRVIGLPGDHVQCCDAQGRIMVNGVPLDEPYLYPGNAPSTVSFGFTVPDGRLWVMGYHRALSPHSRSHLGER